LDLKLNDKKKTFFDFILEPSEAEGLIHFYIHDLRLRKVIISVKGYNYPHLSYAF